MKGARVSNSEAFVYGNTLLMLRLLKIGIPYQTVMELDEEEAFQIIGADAAITEYIQEKQNG